MMKVWRVAAVIALLLAAAVRPLNAAGTVTVTTTDVGRGVTKFTITWVSTAGGAVSGNTFAVPVGQLVQIKFVPDGGGTQPTDLYDVTLIDTNSVDLLNGLGANLSNATSAIFQWNPELFNDASQNLDLVVANAGAAKGGTVYLWVRR